MSRASVRMRGSFARRRRPGPGQCPKNGWTFICSCTGRFRCAWVFKDPVDRKIPVFFRLQRGGSGWHAVSKGTAVSTQPLNWRDDGTTMTWDHFSWDAVVFTSTTMKNLKMGIGKSDPVLLQVTDSVIAGATGNAALANPPITLVELGTLKTAAVTAITDEAQSREACL